MAKIDIKTRLKTSDNIYTYDVKAILLDDVIKYTEDSVRVIVKWDNSKVTMIRENNEYQLKLIFEKNKKTVGNYLLKENNMNYYLDIYTKSLTIDKNRIYVVYELNDETREYTLIKE